MKIFMIGGTGLLGCEAATTLIKRGHQVKSVALPPLPEGAPIPKEMELVFGDINKKTDEEIEQMLEGCDCFIFAAGVDERKEFPAPVMDYYSRSAKKQALRELLFLVLTSHILLKSSLI